MRAFRTRLLLVDLDDLRVLWDAVLRHRLSLDPGDFDLEVAQVLQERLGELLSEEWEHAKE